MFATHRSSRWWLTMLHLQCYHDHSLPNTSEDPKMPGFSILKPKSWLIFSDILQSYNSRSFWNHRHSGVWLWTRLRHITEHPHKCTMHIIRSYILRSECRCRLLIRIQCPFTCGEMVWVALVGFYSSVWLHIAHFIELIVLMCINCTDWTWTWACTHARTHCQRAKMEMIVLAKSIVIMIV